MRCECIFLFITLLFCACGNTTAAPATAASTDVAADAALHDGNTAPDTAKPDVQKDIGKADIPPAVCKPAGNTGCSEPGTHCGYDDADLIACVKDGAHGVGEDCADGGGCKIGACVQSQNGKTACAPYCVSDVQCDSNQCNKLEGKKGKVCDVSTYTPCDLLAQNCADKTLACYDSPNGFVCLSKGSLAKDAVCDASNQCAVGLACVGASASSKGVCRQVCAFPSGAPACESVTVQCTSFPGSNKFGYCPW